MPNIFASVSTVSAITQLYFIIQPAISGTLSTMVLTITVPPTVSIDASKVVTSNIQGSNGAVVTYNSLTKLITFTTFSLLST